MQLALALGPNCSLWKLIRVTISYSLHMSVGRKTIIDTTSASRTLRVATRDLARIVQTHEVTQDNINLTFIACAIEHSFLPLATSQMCKTISFSINNHYGLRM
jgi:hypothetical protein